MQTDKLALLIKSVKGYFEGNKIKFTLAEDGETVFLKYTLESVVVDVSVICLPTFYVIHVTYPFAFSQSKNHAVLIKINSINTGLPLGSFEMADNHERVRYKFGMYLGEKNISEKEFGEQFDLTLFFAEKYLDKLKDLMN